MTEVDNTSAAERAERKWKDLIDNGKRFRGISPNVDPDSPPKWFDKDQFVESQRVSHKYYGSLCFGQFVGLLLVLHFSDGLAPLAVTGNSSTVPKLFRRYLSTMVHVKNWFDFDPFDKNSRSYKSLKHVRGLHRKVSEMMNEKSGRVEGTDNLWIPQYGMCHAQFAFTGFVALFPEECGIHSITDQEFASLLYFWRVIGYCLGTDDRFNLCSGTPEETVELCKLMFWREWHPLIAKEELDCPAGEEMAKGICLSMNKLAKFIHWNVVMKYWYPIIKVDKTIQLKSFAERFWYYTICFLMPYATKLSLFRYLLSAVSRLDISLAIRFKRYKYETLKKEYPNESYGNTSCPFDVNFNYIDAFQAFSTSEATKL